MKKFILGLAAASLCALAPTFAFAGPYEDGVKAYDAKNYTGAWLYFNELANNGNSGAQIYLGAMHEFENAAVTKSDTKAAMWYRKAAEQGNALGQYNLGIMYANGKGVPQSYTEAMKWYKKSAAQGRGNATNSIGYLYDKGLGVTQSDTEAANWYLKSAELGNAIGQANIGIMYRAGRGVPKNSEKAIFWYKKSAAQNFQQAKDALVEMGVKPELKKNAITNTKPTSPQWIIGKWGLVEKDGRGGYREPNNNSLEVCSRPKNNKFVEISDGNDGLVVQITSEPYMDAFFGEFIKGPATAKHPDAKHAYIYPKEWKKAWLELKNISPNIVFATVHNHEFYEDNNTFYLKRCKK